MEPLYPVSVRRTAEVIEYLQQHFPNRVHETPLVTYLSAVTSRCPREEEMDGQNYCFVMREQMEKDIKESRYLEHGEYDANLYGTKIDSIHEVVNAGRTCILDVNPQVSQRHKPSTRSFLLP